MAKLEQKLHVCQWAVATLDEALGMPFSVIVRDACIQRFEYTFESLWKLLKAYLVQYEGILCNSPKSCFREALSVGLLAETATATCLVMTDDRNLTSHTYLEVVAEAIYRKLPAYLTVMETLLSQIQLRLDQGTVPGEKDDG